MKICMAGAPVSADPHVLHVFSSSGLYGAEHAVLGLIRASAALGIDSTLACIDNPHLREQPLYERARAFGIPAERIPCAGRLDGATTQSLRAMVKRVSNPLLHVHGYKSAFYALRARRARPEVPILATLHGWITNTRALWLYRILELQMLRRIEQVCIVAEGMRAPLRAAGIAAERISLIENGIDTTRFRPGGPALARAELDIPLDAFVFGSALRLSAEKNPLGLLDAFTRMAHDIPDAWLVLAGDGPQRTEFERRMAESGVAGRVRLLGARDDPECVYPLFDCFVLPSLSEGLPLALLEAMACERPIIASDVGQIAKVLEGLSATLVPAGDLSALAAAMRRQTLAAHQPAAALRHRVEARYSVTRMAREYAEVYRRLGARHVGNTA